MLREFISYSERFIKLLVQNGKHFVDVLFSPIINVIADYFPQWVSDLIKGNLREWLSNMSIIEVMFGAGLVYLVVLAFVRFFIKLFG